MPMRLFSTSLTQSKFWESPEFHNQWYLVDNLHGDFWAAYGGIGGQDMLTLNRSDAFTKMSAAGVIGFSCIKESFTTSALKMPDAVIVGALLCGSVLDECMGKEFRSLHFTALAQMCLMYGVPDEDAVRILDRHNVSRTEQYRKPMEKAMGELVKKMVSEYDVGEDLLSGLELSIIAPIETDFTLTSLEKEEYLYGLNEESASYASNLGQVKELIRASKEDQLSALKDIAFWEAEMRAKDTEELLAAKDEALMQLTAREEELESVRLLKTKSIEGTEKALASLDVIDLRESLAVQISGLKGKLAELRVEEAANSEKMAMLAEEKTASVASFDDRIKAAESEHAVASAGLSAASDRLKTSVALLEEIKKSLMETLALI